MKAWPVRTQVRVVARYWVPGAIMTRYLCAHGHEWSETGRANRWCRWCVIYIANSMEKFAAAIGGREPKAGGRHHPARGRPSRLLARGAQRCGHVLVRRPGYHRGARGSRPAGGVQGRVGRTTWQDQCQCHRVGGPFGSPWETYQTARMFGHGPVTPLDRSTTGS